MNDLNENNSWIKPQDDPLPSIAIYGALFFGGIATISLTTRNFILLLISSPLCVLLVMSYLGYQDSGRILQFRVLKNIYRNGNQGSIEYQRLMSSFESDPFVINRLYLNQALWLLKREGMVEISDDGSMILVVSENVENSYLYKDLVEYL